MGRSLAEILRDVEGVQVTLDEVDPDFAAVFAESPEPAEDAEVIEGSSLRTKPVSASHTSSFTHFGDGAQMSRAAFYDGGMPGKYAYLNAAVAERIDREILDVVEEVSSAAVFCPWGKAAAAIQQAGEPPVRILAIEPGDGMAAVNIKVMNEISAERSRLEQDVCSRWINRGEPGRLLVDGGIGNLAVSASAEPGKLVGLVKSHRKQYFTSATATTILGLREAERSSVFLATSYRGQRSPTHSWYLRLRSDLHRSPAFGLVRVELLPSEHSAELADEVSAWILAERSPLSMPDARYDRLIYPIHAVEKLLKARQPSTHAIRSVIGV